MEATGDDACLACAPEGCPCGTRERPLATLMAAQRIADAFVERELASSTSSLPPDAIRVVIQVAGEFDGQWFRWRHAHRSVSLTLRPAPGRSATFRGAGHPCQTGYCFTDDRPPGDGSAPTFAPVACAANELTRRHCEQSGVVSYVGYSFFAAEGDRAWFHDHHTTYDGFGSIHIEDIEVHDYHTAVRVAGWTAADVRARWPADAGPDAVDVPVVGLQVTGCRFERIGEIANNEPSDDPTQLTMADAYTAIALSYVNESIFAGNVFVDVVDYGTAIDHKILMHAVYAKSSDQNVFVGNTFINVSGQPLKFRNSSDRNVVIGNRFQAGGDSVTRFPVQDWYCDWQNVGFGAQCAQTELPSFENVLAGNSYEGGYLSDPRQESPDVIAIACPTQQPPGGGYDVMQSCAGTPARMIVDHTAFACSVGGAMLSRLNTHLVTGSDYLGSPAPREVCGTARCWRLFEEAMEPAQRECPVLP